MSHSILRYQSNGTWSGYTDVNAGDPGNPWPVNGSGQLTQFSLVGYNQNTTQYLANAVNGGVLSMTKAGHAALILDDSISPGSNGAWMTGITVVNGGAGSATDSTIGQLIDMTSPAYTYGTLTINAGSGNDILMGNAGLQTIKGNAGSDYIWGGSGTDNLYGGSGNDTVIAGGNGNDQLFGGAGNDSLVAGNGNDVVSGGSGADTIIAGLGNQSLDGGSGNDTLDLSKLAGSANINPGDHSATVTVNGTAHTYAINSFETIIGTNQASYFDGGHKNPETLIGGAGNDHFHSESGGDLVTGGGGANVFDWMKIFVLAAGKSDTITDFQVGTDHLDLSDFLKGQAGLKHPDYNHVVQLTDNTAGTMVSVLAGGSFHNIVELNSVHGAALTDLLLA